MELTSRIVALIEPSLLAMGFLLVRVRFGGAKRPVLQIMAERPDGTMTVEDCAEVSRAVSAILDVEDPISGEYVLEVSSPGIDRPLVKLDDYRRFAGYEAKVETAMPVEGRKRYRGRLTGIEGEDVLIHVDATDYRLPFPLISEARLVLTDDLIAASLKGALLPPGGEDAAKVAAAVPGTETEDDTAGETDAAGDKTA
ncbi:ribosome maturation factor RimP [Zavarzinia compransoris]|uniref:Ribosome maturation factor RimP n=1 Tax=Zavarzinia compransoris TaxID=1264899 RepID=A0A317E746_9PROT|nr:ribosome maturation factor RimP [Zavarzinia compransoris]TDP44267.1 ribosome maturation factor RimP [Zavarzinia compransoris]